MSLLWEAVFKFLAFALDLGAELGFGGEDGAVFRGEELFVFFED